MFCFLSTRRRTPGFRVRKRAHPVAVSWLVILSLVSNSLPALAFADEKSSSPPGVTRPVTDQPPPSSSASSKKLPALDLENLPLDPVKIAAATYFQENQDQVLSDIRKLAVSLEKHLENKRIELGSAKMDDMIFKGAKDTLMVTDSAVGWAEPTTIDNVRLTRVVHQESGIVFAIVPKELKNMDTPHWKRFLARQNTVAGKDGRPVIVIQLDSSLEDFTRNNTDNTALGAIDRLLYHPKPIGFKEKLSANWNAIWAGHPDRSMVGMAALFTGGQVVISSVLGAIQMAQPGGSFHYEPVALSALFGMAIGSYSPTWKNFTTMTKSPFQRMLRTALLSYAFAYSLTIWMDGGVQNLSILDPQGLFIHAMIWTNVIVNNYTKDSWTWFTRIREDMGMNRGIVEHRLFKRFKFKKTAFEYQGINLGSYTLKMLDLIHLSVPLSVMNNMNVPLGKALFISSAIWVQYLALRYAKKLNYERTPEIKAQLMYTLTGGPFRKFGTAIGKYIYNAVKRSPSICTTLLTGRAPDHSSNTDAK